MVHDDPDDLGKRGNELSRITDNSGNAGAPVAYGVIGFADPK